MAVLGGVASILFLLFPDVCRIASPLSQGIGFISFPSVLVVKNLLVNAGDLGSVLGLGRCPGEGNGNALQYSCLENPHEQKNLVGTVHGIAKSQT